MSIKKKIRLSNKLIVISKIKKLNKNKYNFIIIQFLYKMDQALVNEIQKLIESAKNHAVHFMNDPPSRAWSGWRGRCDTCIKKAKQIYQQTNMSFSGLVSRTNIQINDFKEQITEKEQKISNLKDQLQTLRNSHNSIQHNLNKKINQKQKETIDKDKILINTNQQITLLKKVLNQSDKNQAKMKQKILDLESRNKKLQYSLQEARQELKNQFNQNDKYTEYSKKPSTKNMSKPPSESQSQKHSQMRSKTFRQSSERSFHFQKEMQCFSSINKNKILKLDNNNKTVINTNPSNQSCVLQLLQCDIDSKHDKVFGFKILRAEELAVGMCCQPLAKKQNYSLQTMNNQTPVSGVWQLVRRKEDQKEEMFVGLKYLPKKKQIQIMKASKQGKKQAVKIINQQFFKLDMKPCLVIRGKCQIALIQQ